MHTRFLLETDYNKFQAGVIKNIGPQIIYATNLKKPTVVIGNIFLTVCKKIKWTFPRKINFTAIPLREII